MKTLIFKTRLRAIGDSQGIILPSVILKVLQTNKDQYLNLYFDGDNILIKNNVK